MKFLVGGRSEIWKICCLPPGTGKSESVMSRIEKGLLVLLH